MHKVFYAVGVPVLGIGVTMLFGQAIPLISQFANWEIIGIVTTAVGLSLLAIAVVLHLRASSATRSRHVRFMTNPSTGYEVFRNLMSTPIRIVGIDMSDPNVDHMAVGLPWRLDPGGEVALNPRRNPPGRSTLTIHWEDARGRTHRYRILVSRSGPLVEGLQLY